MLGDNPFGLLLAFRPKHPEVRPLQPGTGDPPAVRMSGCTGITFYYFAGKIHMHMLLCFAKKGISIPRSIAAVNQCLYNFIQIRRDMYSSTIYRGHSACTAQWLLGELIAWVNLRSWQQGLYGRVAAVILGNQAHISNCATLFRSSRFARNLRWLGRTKLIRERLT